MIDQIIDRKKYSGRGKMKKRIAKWVAWYMVAVMFLFGITPKIDAGFSPSELIGQSQINRSTDVEKIGKLLEIKMVRERLHAFGFSQEEIQTRVNQLTDDQIHQVALQLDRLNVGGDGGEVVIIILLILIIIGLIFYFQGHRIIIK
jgi:hypothetical protein